MSLVNIMKKRTVMGGLIVIVGLVIVFFGAGNTPQVTNKADLAASGTSTNSAPSPSVQTLDTGSSSSNTDINSSTAKTSTGSSTSVNVTTNSSLVTTSPGTASNTTNTTECPQCEEPLTDDSTSCGSTCNPITPPTLPLPTPEPPITTPLEPTCGGCGGPISLDQAVGHMCPMIECPY